MWCRFVLGSGGILKVRGRVLRTRVGCDHDLGFKHLHGMVFAGVLGVLVFVGGGMKVTTQ